MWGSGLGFLALLMGAADAGKQCPAVVVFVGLGDELHHWLVSFGLSFFAEGSLKPKH